MTSLNGVDCGADIPSAAKAGILSRTLYGTAEAVPFQNIDLFSGCLDDRPLGFVRRPVLLLAQIRFHFMTVFVMRPFCGRSAP